MSLWKQPCKPNLVQRLVIRSERQNQSWKDKHATLCAIVLMTLRHNLKTAHPKKLCGEDCAGTDLIVSETAPSLRSCSREAGSKDIPVYSLSPRRRGTFQAGREVLHAVNICNTVSNISVSNVSGAVSLKSVHPIWYLPARSSESAQATVGMNVLPFRKGKKTST
nr:hypothetical protein CFP56_20619 [Quercus suber]